ncbi:glycolate oxidase subunit GlcF [Inquilinus sp. CA228]|uniref:glycolate oxidase subunit GlcF n=1 Tax=Inquilinus sp. CA228 TaxID=3455609 RepID=UPI003F8D73C0
MQTAFTRDQLARPDIAEADGILKTCVHYGFCTATCPTYVLFRDENDSPRGRIDLIRAMLERDGPPDAKTVHHLDRCLSCLSCVTTCAVKVDYAHLIDIARNHIEKTFRRPWSDRLLRGLLARTLPYPGRFLAALRLASLAQPFAGAMPGRRRGLLALAKARPARPGLLAPAAYPAQGERRLRVALLAGCAQQALDREVNAATIRVLQRHGCEVVVAAGAGCCGALPLHMGREVQAKSLAAATVAAWSGLLDRGLDAVVVNASGCGTTVKDYGHLLGTDPARRIGALARDVTEILAQLGLQATGGMKPYRVAYHDACSLQHGQRVTEPPRQLLRQAGFAVLDVPEKHFCCGSAGTYNLLQPDIADALGRRKAAHVEGVDPDIVAAGNLGCIVQIARFSAVPVVHTVELLDWATGGPEPGDVRSRPLREPAPVVATVETDATPAAPGGAPSGNPGFW